MKHVCMLISVADINAARKFYEDLFGLEVFQDYGRNIAFTCGLALQQDFEWLVNVPKEKVLNRNFLSLGITLLFHIHKGIIGCRQALDFLAFRYFL